MPLIVDHDERRALIANVVKEMIAETGMESVTVRAVARRVGYSSTILSHYFRDKQHLLIAAFASVLSESPKRVQAKMDDGGSLLDCLELLLPNSPANLRDWQAWFGFWGTVTHDPDLAAERLAGIEETQKMLAHILQYAIDRGELPADLHIPSHAERIQIFLNGLVSMVIMKPAAWPPTAQREALIWQIGLMRQHPQG
ncbi:TetR/AcrR family transcriptional regulator [Aquisediminimonas sediminicola]|uniref:TetR/AcrR family transcriptional regulator n=1 Tax=Alteraquisediminimonas sediminicola TaxID=2676787 RepID=UPI001C8E6EC7|nr:TetR/AcrR family transcriptional regulator [Aquisediminimonas sediminicola]